MSRRGRGGVGSRRGRRPPGVIVERAQAEGGDNHASADFFQKLRALTKSRGVRMIEDEVQTGCGSSGTFWAHEAWNLEHPPDVVTFSKKIAPNRRFLRRRRSRPRAPVSHIQHVDGRPREARATRGGARLHRREQLVRSSQVLGGDD